MSYSLRVAKARYRGDPGLLSFVGKAIKGVTSFLPGPLAGAGAAVGNLLDKPQKPAAVPTVVKPPTFAPGVGFAAPPPRSPIGVNLPFAGAPGAGVRLGNTFVGVGPAQVAGAAQAMVGCPSGYRPNKTSYWLKDGTFVPAGSRCVKIRRRNALNPRALDRAIGRIASAKRASKRIGRVSIRKSCG